MDVKEHERLSNITLRHKLKSKNSTFIVVLYFVHVYLSNKIKRLFMIIPHFRVDDLLI